MTAPEPSPPAWARRFTLGVVLLASVPFVVLIVSALGAHWYPSGDDALELLRIRDVGGAHTPLLGAWSRWGWAHPGPALFWVLAPFERVGGADGVLVGVAVLGWASVVGSLLLARMVGGVRFLAVIAVGLAVLVHGLGLTVLFDPWNPSVPLLPFLVTTLLVLAAVMVEPWWLVGAIATGTFVVQTHAGYLGLVGALLVAGLIVVTVRNRRAAAVTVGLGAVLWVPAVVEQFGHEPGNLGLVARYVRTPGTARAGWSLAVRTLGTHLRPFGPWVTDREYTRDGFERLTSPWAALVVVAVLVGLTVLAARRGLRIPAAAGALALGLVGVGLVTSARITGLYVPYLLGWWRVIAALVWIALTWIVVELVARRAPVGTDRVVAVVAGLAVVAAAIASVGRAPAAVPQSTISTALRHVGPPTLAAVPRDGPVLVRGRDAQGVDGSAQGLFAYLEPHRSNVRYAAGPGRKLQFGAWRLAAAGTPVRELTISTVPTLDPDWRPPAGARVVARWDALRPAERARARRLQRRVARAVGATPGEAVPVDTEYWRRTAVRHGARSADVVELARLQARGNRAVVTLSDTEVPAP